MAATVALISLAVAVTVSQKADVIPLEVERLAILGIALAAGYRAWRGGWPDASFSDALALTLVPLGGLALVFSRTRSAWLGVIAGLAVLAALRKPKLLYALPAALGLILVLSPRSILERVTLSDASSRDRYYMWQAGLDMVIDKPIFGQGTGMILDVYPKFRWEGAPNPNAPHLHNNFVQVAAERGAPCLLFLFWLLFILGREAWRTRRQSRMGVIALAILTTTLVSGMFEYTLGDSEILMLVLLLCALPFSLREPVREASSSENEIVPSGPAPQVASELVLEQ
jgi:O-antigen ligase